MLASKVAKSDSKIIFSRREFKLVKHSVALIVRIRLIGMQLMQIAELHLIKNCLLSVNLSQGQ